METLFRTPKAVLQAKETQRGMHLAFEILVFIAVFFVCTIGEIMIFLPAQVVMLAQNQLYLNAVSSGDAEQISEAAVAAMSSDLYTIVTLFATAMMIGVIFLFCRLIQKRKLSTLGFVKKGCGKEYAKGIVVGFIMFSAAVLICILTGVASFEKSDSFTVSMFLLFTAGYMVQGMAEEVLCRGYFMVSLGRRYPMVAAVVLNATAFAALHLLNPGIAPLAIINLILFGIFASVCFIYTENLWLIGALHSVWNLLQGNVYGIKVSGMENTCSIFSSEMTKGREIFHGGDFGLEGGLAVTIVLMAGIVVLLVLINKKKDTAAEEGI